MVGNNKNTYYDLIVYKEL